MIIVASLHLHVAWYVVLLLLLLLPSFLLRSSNFGTRHESGRKRESRVNGSHRGGKSGKRRNPISQRRKRASIATYRHPSRALPSKGKAGGESSAERRELVPSRWKCDEIHTIFNLRQASSIIRLLPLKFNDTSYRIF